MAARDDDRHATGDVREAQRKQRVALRIRKQELLRVIGKDADAVDALVEHAIEHAPLTVEVEPAVAVERRGSNRIDAGWPRIHHDACAGW